MWVNFCSRIFLKNLCFWRNRMDFHRVKREEEDELVAGGEEEQEAYIPCKDASFLRTIRKSHLINGMSIPRKFYNEFKKNFDRGIILQLSPRSTAWHVGVSHRRTTGPYASYILGSGWKSFVADNEVQVGDIMIFRLIKHNIFSFEIYGAKDGLEKIDARVSAAAAAAKGQNSDSSHEDESDEDYNLLGKGKGTKKLMHKMNERHGSDEMFRDETSIDSEVHDHQEMPPNDDDSMGSVSLLVTKSSTLFVKAPYHSTFPRSDMRIFLIDCNKKKWPVSWHSKARTMAGGFAAFAHHHRIRIGDSLRFDPHGMNYFGVKITPAAAANAKAELSI